MNFAAFQLWREECLRTRPDLLDCAETNLYRALASLQPKLAAGSGQRTVYRCDLARTWLKRYGFPENLSRRALVCRGVRHALTLIFKELAGAAALWVPSDVYPVYLELARAAEIEPQMFPSLPELKFPTARPAAGAEYLLVANPWKPLGRFLTDEECTLLTGWLEASPRRYLLVDCVYDLGVPFHFTTQKLVQTGRAILLHSVTKGWLWPRTFGIALFGEVHSQLEAAFHREPPTPEQLQLAEQLLSNDAGLPVRVAIGLEERKQRLLAVLPKAVASTFIADPVDVVPGGYFFPVRLTAEKLQREHGVLAIPASAFGALWDGSVLTSLSENFAGGQEGGPA